VLEKGQKITFFGFLASKKIQNENFLVFKMKPLLIPIKQKKIQKYWWL
jgi:hypothetical protein